MEELHQAQWLETNDWASKLAIKWGNKHQCVTVLVCYNVLSFRPLFFFIRLQVKESRLNEHYISFCHFNLTIVLSNVVWKAAELTSNQCCHCKVKTSKNYSGGFYIHARTETTLNLTTISTNKIHSCNQEHNILYHITQIRIRG